MSKIKDQLKLLLTHFTPSEVESFGTSILDKNAVLWGLEDKNNKVRQATIGIIAESKQVDLMPNLYASLHDSSEVVRKKTVIAVQRIDEYHAFDSTDFFGEQLKGQLQNDLKTGAKFVRKTYTSELNDSNALFLLGGLLNTKQLDLRTKAIGAFLELSSDKPEGILDAISAIEPSNFINVVDSILEVITHLVEQTSLEGSHLYLKATGSKITPDVLPVLFTGIARRTKYYDTASQVALTNKLVSAQRQLQKKWAESQSLSILESLYEELENGSIKRLIEYQLEYKFSPPQSGIRKRKSHFYGSRKSRGKKGSPRTLKRKGKGKSTRKTAIAPSDAKNSDGDRYTDYSFTEKMSNKKHPPSKPLRKLKYYLFAKITSKPTGISVKKGKRFPIPQPVVGRKYSLYLSVKSDDFKIRQTVRKVELDFSGDSTIARIEVEPNSISKDNQDKKRIELKWYYHFNLIEIDEIECLVLDIYDKTEFPIQLNQKKTELKFNDLQYVQTSSINFTIDKSLNGDYQISVIAKNEKNRTVEFSFPLTQSTQEFDSVLYEVRKNIHKCCVSSGFTEKLETGLLESRELARELAESGQRLWNILFKSRTSDPIYSFGNWLKENPIKEDSIIQVSTTWEAREFIFPWNFLFDADLPDKGLVDIHGFWGYRYMIQQNYFDRNHIDNANPEYKSNVGFFFHEEIEGAKNHKNIFDKLDPTRNHITIVNHYDEKESGLDYLKSGGDKILYFFTHGHTKYNEEESLKKFIAYLRETSNIYEDYEFQQDYSWIELSRGRIELVNDLYDVVTFNQSPFVFLNMCESALIYSSMTSNFVNFFLDRGAKSVIGTECEMTSIFAAHFSEQLFKKLINGEDLGSAFLNTKKELYKNFNNPIGLAYTLYGELNFKL